MVLGIETNKLNANALSQNSQNQISLSINPNEGIIVELSDG